MYSVQSARERERERESFFQLMLDSPLPFLLPYVYTYLVVISAIFGLHFFLFFNDFSWKSWHPAWLISSRSDIRAYGLKTTTTCRSDILLKTIIEPSRLLGKLDRTKSLIKLFCFFWATLVFGTREYECVFVDCETMWIHVCVCWPLTYINMSISDCLFRCTTKKDPRLLAIWTKWVFSLYILNLWNSLNHAFHLDFI